jgi:hypothetical protein
MISFVVPFHSFRLNNLRQTIRFMEARENSLSGCELILLCQDRCDPISSKFNIRQINFDLPGYHRHHLLNQGIPLARFDPIVILDSDRIMPEGYFKRALARLGPKTAITTLNLFYLSTDYTDAEILSGQIIKREDFRSMENECGRKNMFSGNTMMLKSDYQAIGGMDESYVGYGYEDNDMTENIRLHGFNEIYLEEEELHLFHLPEIIWKGAKIDRSQFKILSATNGLHLCRKWHKSAGVRLSSLVEEVKKELPSFPQEMRDRFMIEYEKGRVSRIFI